MKKKTILSILDSLEKINDSIIRSFESGEPVSMETLVDCQDSAIAVGNEIERYYGAAGEEAVHLLEAYCENLFQMSSKPDDLAFCRKLAKKIQKRLVQIKNHVKYDLPQDKKEVVFLPYKASMWDSLESVWKAADADPDCDAYVIPIPYFDKNPDGSFREEHYEGDQYPKNVPITRYDEYDLETRHPDIIYIHNPYDECNHVTSVHPYFYSRNLRNFTDKLVYIPYFILGEIEPDDQAAIDGMKHFCFTPGTIYADQVIVQSENMRQIYINEYMRAAKEMELGGEHVDRAFLEKKFLGTGSPKVDKVLNTKKEELEIPAEWLKVIEKPDGSWKRIVFYNTSVSALLHHDEKMLRKMKSVFEIFRENRDEVALLWRPHPLIQATIESMRPQLWEAYQELRDRYVEEGWGIYDDTADMDRAVVLSDAYYGDHSSVLQLCEKNGKPSLIQNAMRMGEKGFEKAWLISRTAEIDDENGIMWMVTFYTSTLLKVDFESGTLLNSYQIPVDGISDYDFLDVKKVDDYLYFAPFNALHMYCFNIRDEKFVKIEFPLSEYERMKRNKFGKIFHVKNSLYIVGYNLALIIKLDLCSQQLKRIEGFCAEDEAFSRDGITIDDDLYIPLFRRNEILHIITEDDSWEKIVIDNHDCNGFGTITNTEQGIVLTDLADNRIFCDRDGKKIVKCNLQMLSEGLLDQQLRSDYYQYQKVYCYKKKEYYFSVCKASIWMRDEQNNKKELQYKYPYDSQMEIDDYSKFQMLIMYENKIYFQARTNGDVFVVDLDKDEIQKYIFQIPDKYEAELYSELMKYKRWISINETDIYSLQVFIKYLLHV